MSERKSAFIKPLQFVIDSLNLVLCRFCTLIFYTTWKCLFSQEIKYTPLSFRFHFILTHRIGHIVSLCVPIIYYLSMNFIVYFMNLNCASILFFKCISRPVFYGGEVWVFQRYFSSCLSTQVLITFIIKPVENCNQCKYF